MSHPTATADARLAALARLDADFDPDVRMPRSKLHGPGYHTTLPDGTSVHDLRRSLHFAVIQLATGEPERVRRGREVIRAVLALQETDPYKPTYGIWPWFLEEPVERMSPPDWNWADFCGGYLLQGLRAFGDRIDDDTRERMRSAIGHAAWSIFRRNVQPGYTNIAVMGGWVSAAAGELLGEPRLLDYGRRRLARFVEHTRRHGGFNEYNSPTYTMVVLHETERGLAIVGDPEVRASAEAIRRIAWETIAEHFHPPTGQWAGPHARAYHDRLTPTTARELAQRLGFSLQPDGQAAAPDFAAVSECALDDGSVPLPCPDDLRPRFRQLPSAELVVRRCFEDRGDEEKSPTGTTWMNQRACLGTMNRETTWTQRRPVIAYWKPEAGPAVVLRLRLLKDGRDFASGLLFCRQDRHRAEGHATLASDQGDFHCSLDRPADGVFRGADLRLRWELSGQGAKVRALGPGKWELWATGGARAVVTLGAGGDGGEALFEGQPVKLEEGSGPEGSLDHAWADAVCFSGGLREIHLKNPPAPTRLPFSVSIESA